MKAILSGQQNMELLVFMVIVGMVVLYYTYKQTTSKSRINPETRRRTIILAGHDMERIERLLDSARRHQPDQEEQWYWEKILHEMERDRRA